MGHFGSTVPLLVIPSLVPTQALPKNGGGEPRIGSHVTSWHDGVVLTIK